MLDNVASLHDTEYLITVIRTFWGKFWIFFAFLLILNVIDYITGILKANYLGVVSSRASYRGMYKKVFLWIMVFISLGISFMLLQIGRIINVKAGFMAWLGILVLFHAIVNEFRSIIENIVLCDKGNIVPNWLTKGLEVTNKIIQKKGEDFVQKVINQTDNIKEEEINSFKKDISVEKNIQINTQTTIIKEDSIDSVNDINSNKNEIK